MIFPVSRVNHRHRLLAQPDVGQSHEMHRWIKQTYRNASEVRHRSAFLARCSPFRPERLHPACRNTLHYPFALS